MAKVLDILVYTLSVWVYLNTSCSQITITPSSFQQLCMQLMIITVRETKNQNNNHNNNSVIAITETLAKVFCILSAVFSNKASVVSLFFGSFFFIESNPTVKLSFVTLFSYDLCCFTTLCSVLSVYSYLCCFEQSACHFYCGIRVTILCIYYE